MYDRGSASPEPVPNRLIRVSENESMLQIPSHGLCETHINVLSGVSDLII